MAYRVIQWGTGAIGKHTLRAVLDHPELELVGLKVYSEVKLGRDAGELADRSATGIRAVRDMADLPLSAADCVLYVPMQPDYDEIAALLRAGVSVITTAGNMYPQTYGEEVVDKLQAACRAGASVFHGSGINPAFMSDVLPLTLSGLSYRAQRIIVQEVSDVAHYASTAPGIMMDNIGFGKTPQEAIALTSMYHAERRVMRQRWRELGSPQTIYQDIRRLPPAHYALCHADGRLEVARYWSVPVAGQGGRPIIERSPVLPG